MEDRALIAGAVWEQDQAAAAAWVSGPWSKV